MSVTFAVLGAVSLIDNAAEWRKLKQNAIDFAG